MVCYDFNMGLNRGFVLLSILLVVLIVFAVSDGAYYVTHQNSFTQPVAQVATRVSAPQNFTNTLLASNTSPQTPEATNTRPTASINTDSLISSSARPTIKGNATSISDVSLLIWSGSHLVYRNDNIPVVNGTWSSDVSTDLNDGAYDVNLYCCGSATSGLAQVAQGTLFIMKRDFAIVPKTGDSPLLAIFVARLPEPTNADLVTENSTITSGRYVIDPGDGQGSFNLGDQPIVGENPAQVEYDYLWPGTYTATLYANSVADGYLKTPAPDSVVLGTTTVVVNTPHVTSHGSATVDQTTLSATTSTPIIMGTFAGVTSICVVVLSSGALPPNLLDNDGFYLMPNAATFCSYGRGANSLILSDNRWITDSVWPPLAIGPHNVGVYDASTGVLLVSDVLTISNQ